ncbi:hypothetical protein NCC78_29110, partial [Micromonospora phytophila]|nr:hypothetical protein [Micromonospora phytophila]
LCQAYRADAGDNPGRTLDNPVFGDLVDAAGGRDKVAGYCDRVLAEEPGRPTSPGTPTQRPGVEPTVRQSGRPAPPSIPAEPPTAPGPGQTTPDRANRTTPPNGGGSQ